MASTTRISLAATASAAAWVLATALGGDARAQSAAEVEATAQVAQAAPAGPATGGATTLAPVRVTGNAPVHAGVAGWPGVPLAEAPVSVTSIGAREIRDSGSRRLADLIRFDAAISDAYNSAGYIDYLTVRGFVLDNRFNYRRDGLPINAETSIPLENKARVDILKGTSGIEAGTSAPGGLVDYVVKRPLEQPLTTALVEWRQPGNALGAFDLSRRFGADQAFGVRLNAAAERLDGFGDGTRGRRHALALAGDWRAGDATLIEAEMETSHRAQPSEAAFSLLGDQLPRVPKPHVSLNNQPWTEPVVFDGTTLSLRATHKLGTDWRLVAHAAQQRLKTDDREAFPFGCSAADGITYYPDRYCPDGTFDLYDFRSENEHRRQSALDLRVEGRATTGPLTHDLAVGGLRTWVKNTFEDFAYNFAGTGTIDGETQLPPAPDKVFANTNRQERSTELYARDRIRFGGHWAVWLGARHTRLERSAVDTQGNGATSFSQSFTTPFAALSFASAPGQLVYASWGRSVESDVAPTLPMYSNAGEALPAAKSRQVELGWKGTTDAWDWNLALFDIRRPRWSDVGACDGSEASCTRALSGEQRHRGIDAALGWQHGPWSARASVQHLKARVENDLDPALDGLKPANVPATSARAGVAWAPPALPGLALSAIARYEGPREVHPDNSVEIGGWATADLAARYDWRPSPGAGPAWTFRLGVDNVFDRRAWRESPYQFSHVYLYALAPRTWRASVDVAF